MAREFYADVPSARTSMVSAQEMPLLSKHSVDLGRQEHTRGQDRFARALACIAPICPRKYAHVIRSCLTFGQMFDQLLLPCEIPCIVQLDRFSFCACISMGSTIVASCALDAIEQSAVRRSESRSLYHTVLSVFFAKEPGPTEIVPVVFHGYDKAHLYGVTLTEDSESDIVLPFESMGMLGTAWAILADQCTESSSDSDDGKNDE